MDLKQTLKKLEQEQEFTKWKDKNRQTYFSYAFKIPQEMSDEEWHIGFYNKNNDKITTFVTDGNSVNVRHEEEMFKKEETKVNEIKIVNLKLGFDSILLKASEFQKKNYPKDISVKTIAILQNISDFGDVWNITYVTEAFNTLNMKIDASSGKVIEHKLTSIFSFRQN